MQKLKLRYFNLFEFFDYTLTCQSWVSVSFVLNAGIPDSRIPFAAFQ